MNRYGDFDKNKSIWLKETYNLIENSFLVCNVNKLFRKASIKELSVTMYQHSDTGLISTSVTKMGVWINTSINQVLRRAQLYTTAEVEPWTVGASMDKTFKRDTALNLDCDQIFDITWVFFYTKQMSRFYKSIKDFFFKLFKSKIK